MGTAPQKPIKLMATAQGPCRPTPPAAARALWFRCPKCGRGGDTFAVVYEPAEGLVDERLRVTCDRCGYVGFEDTADARAKGADAPAPPPNDRVNSLTHVYHVSPAAMPQPRSFYVLIGMLLALGAAFAGRIAAVVL